MAKAVLTVRPDSHYDDVLEYCYHFPRTYLRVMERALGDMVVYYAPRRTSADGRSTGGLQAYFAVARIVRIEADRHRADHFYAFMGDFAPFVHPVPYRIGATTFEPILTRPDGGTSKGAFGRSVRALDDDAFAAICQAGFAPLMPAVVLPAAVGFAEVQAPFDPIAPPRAIVTQIVQRPFRDRAFRAAVIDAYEATCAFTGISVRNGGGWTEAEAAHIQAVTDAGPDSVRNGVALCSTMHALFDRGFLSLADDLTILTARDFVSPKLQSLLNASGRMITPSRSEFMPHPTFLRFHREHRFKDRARA